MNGRVYDPLLGRFGTPDPMTENPFSTQGWNRYSYVGNSPVNFTDPSGYCFLGCFWNRSVRLSTKATTDRGSYKRLEQRGNSGEHVAPALGLDVLDPNYLELHDIRFTCSSNFEVSCKTDPSQD